MFKYFITKNKLCRLSISNMIIKMFQNPSLEYQHDTLMLGSQQKCRHTNNVELNYLQAMYIRFMKQCLLGLDDLISKIFDKVYIAIPQSTNIPNLTACSKHLEKHPEAPDTWLASAIKPGPPVAGYLGHFPRGRLSCIAGSTSAPHLLMLLTLLPLHLLLTFFTISLTIYGATS